ncbi:hypothetical protein T01_12931 [Trichinella spiralis]|uniref:Uncharacterized protein n=1 Tax=Trichinella spiralis TaxID=6334 RepID=A0A0V1ALK2_TRISP|nr:hypothetical protein T01_12931 [Trichinella spiralis]
MSSSRGLSAKSVYQLRNKWPLTLEFVDVSHHKYL